MALNTQQAIQALQMGGALLHRDTTMQAEYRTRDMGAILCVAFSQHNLRSFERTEKKSCVNKPAKKLLLLCNSDRQQFRSYCKETESNLHFASDDRFVVVSNQQVCLL